MGWLKTFLFKKILSEWIPLSWLDGHKKEISRAITFIAAALLVAKQIFPEFLPVISSLEAFVALLAGLVGKEIAEVHDELKEKYGFGAK